MSNGHYIASNDFLCFIAESLLGQSESRDLQFVQWPLYRINYTGQHWLWGLLVHSHSCRLCCRGKGRLDKHCQLKDAACCLSFSAWADLECEGIESLESGRHVLPASETDMLGYTHTPLPMSARYPFLCALPIPYLSPPLCSASWAPSAHSLPSLFLLSQ